MVVPGRSALNTSVRLVRLVAGPLYFIVSRLFGLWARPTIQPDEPSALIDNPDAEICYVLETGGRR